MKTLLKFLGGAPNIELCPPTRLEKKIKRRRTLLCVLFIALLAFCIYIVWPLIRGWNDLYLEVWSDMDNIGSAERLSYIATFWGAILGAMIAVLATLFTTGIIIHRERQIDRHNERIAHLPIIEINYDKELTVKFSKSRDKEEFLKKNGIQFECCFENMKLFSIRNVGEGVALKVDTTPSSASGAVSYPYYATLSKNEPHTFALEQEGYGYSLCPHYFDIFGNYYKQTIELDDNGELKTYDVPELVKRTERFNYVQ